MLYLFCFLVHKNSKQYASENIEPVEYKAKENTKNLLQIYIKTF